MIGAQAVPLEKILALCEAAHTDSEHGAIFEWLLPALWSGTSYGGRHVQS